MPFPYTPLERKQLAYMQAAAGASPDIASTIAPMFFGTIEGAQERFDTRRAQRQEGMQGLRELAMQLAQGTASEDAVENVVLSQAQQLPLMGPRYGGERRLGALEDFVEGLYTEGPVSGLAPMDVRSQYAGVLDDEDRQGISTAVVEAFRQGTPFRMINQQIEQDLVAAGYDDFSISEGMDEARSAYERLIGTSLEEMRSVGSDLRSMAGGNEIEFGHLSDLGLDTPEFEGLTQGGNVPIESFLAQLVNDPQMYAQLQGALGDYQPDERSLFERTIGGLFGPSSGMPFGV
ncbi:MAG TPA: hypothetical protein VFQ40_07575 [Actinomycetota bacterium]|nr:hypothetical protein [Actinomycetota bacterium]